MFFVQQKLVQAAAGVPPFLTNEYISLLNAKRDFYLEHETS
jgi:hypothetical protein